MRHLFTLRQICLGMIVLASTPLFARAELTHRYSFNDGSAKDSVGKSDGALKGPAKITDGKLLLDNAAKGSGDADIAYLDLGTNLLPKSGSASIVFWVTARQTAPFARILDLGDREGVEGRAFIYYTPRNSSDQARAAISATTTADKTALDSEPIDDGKAHMVAIVIDGDAKKLRVFVDGKEAGAAQDLGDNTLDKVRAAHNWIGRSGFDQDPMLSASIDELRIYNHALKPDEAAAIAKAGPDALPK